MSRSKKPVRSGRTSAPPKIQDRSSEPFLFARKETLEYQSPLPPPQVLAEYEQIIPDFGSRLMANFEAQSAHRIRIESAVIAGDVQAQQRGTVFAFVLAMGVLAFATYLASQGHLTYAIVALFMEIVSLCGIFLVGRHRQADEHNAKRG